MDLFSELVQAFRDDTTSGSESSLLPDALVKRYINRAYRRAGGLFRWPETEDAKKTSTVNGQEYYDYPDNWRPDSIWKLEVDSVDYGDPLEFRDYLYEKENDIPSGLTKMWGNQWRRYFIYPTPTTNGSNNISIWGFKNVDALVNDSDVTIFSYAMPECNDAIVKEAVAIARTKTEQPNESQFASAEAKAILIGAWTKIKQEKVKYERTTPFFEIPDFFGRGRKKTPIGDF